MVTDWIAAAAILYVWFRVMARLMRWARYSIAVRDGAWNDPEHDYGHAFNWRCPTCGTEFDEQGGIIP